MIMNQFINQVEKHMIQLKKRNINTMNEFKIQMFQTRKKIQKNIIKLQYGISQSQFMTNDQLGQNKQKLQNMIQNISIVKNKPAKIQSDKNLSTNYNSRALESRLNQINCQISRYTNNYNSNDLNKENQNPNKKLNTDISIIQQFPVKNITLNNNQDIFRNQQGQNELNLNALKNDQSMEMNTEQVKKVYRKFISPSAGWTVSAQQKDRPQYKHHQQYITPFCQQYLHQPYHNHFYNQKNGKINQDEQNQEEDQFQNEFRKDSEIFGFKQIDERHLTKNNTIKELQQFDQNNQSYNY